MDLELKRGFYCLIFACLTERFSTYIKIWLFFASNRSTFFMLVSVSRWKRKFTPFFKAGEIQLYLKKVTKNLVYRLERRLDFLKTVEIITHRALLQILLSGNYNGCCQNQICLTG